MDISMLKINLLILSHNQIINYKKFLRFNNLKRQSLNKQNQKVLKNLYSKIIKRLII